MRPYVSVGIGTYLIAAFFLAVLFGYAVLLFLGAFAVAAIYRGLGMLFMREDDDGED